MALWRARQGSRRVAPPFPRIPLPLAVTAATAAVHVVLFASSRYHAPCMPFLTIQAGVGLCALMALHRGRSTRVNAAPAGGESKPRPRRLYYLKYVAAWRSYRLFRVLDASAEAS